jgi:hypothetical protein
VKEELPTRLTERAQMGRVFEYASDFDEHGVIHYLATNGRKTEWKNPALTGRREYAPMLHVNSVI